MREQKSHFEFKAYFESSNPIYTNGLRDEINNEIKGCIGT